MRISYSPVCDHMEISPPFELAPACPSSNAPAFAKFRAAGVTSLITAMLMPILPLKVFWPAMLQKLLRSNELLLEPGRSVDCSTA
jgi:hypothetical protein